MNEDGFPVIGIGASAGGIEAMRGFFRGLPANLNAAFVFVTHLSPLRDSLLPDVLSRMTTLTVETAAEGTVPQPGCIYVMPSGCVLQIVNGRFALRILDEGSRETKPVDIFLTSLAVDKGERAVGVILSGGDGDGAIGIKAIKEQGGLTLAQIAGTDGPQSPDMPLSAMRTGYVDFGEPAEQMGQRIARYTSKLSDLKQSLSHNRNHEMQTKYLSEIYTILRQQVGHDFSGYKPSTFLRRLQRRIVVHGLVGIEPYLNQIRTDPAEVAALFRDLLIGVTNFFRDASAFDALKTKVIPQLFQDRAATDVVRIWVPACSTGEEVYSLAILVREHMDTLSELPRVQIFATDIDDRALAVARNGRYPRAYIEAVSKQRVERFFVQETESVVVSKVLRDMCTFAPHNVLRDPPFSKLDLVSCRNLLIYLGADAQHQLLPMLHFALQPKGFLFVGLAENVTRFDDLFETVDKRQRIFRARDAMRMPQLPVIGSLNVAGPMQVVSPRRRTVSTHAALRHAVEAQMLAEFTPPHAVVTRTGEAVHFSSRIGAYLEVAAGQPTRELAAMARRGMRLELRTALREAIERNTIVVRHGIDAELPDGSQQTISLVIKPLSLVDEPEPLFLVVFDHTNPSSVKRDDSNSGDGERDKAIQSLERDLTATKERLQAVIEEYETSLEELKSSNEELYSLNEEMQSANEELEASKEESQSINEELQTVNAELASKIEAVDQMSEDQILLLESSDIASVFLTNDLKIRMFTNAAARIFGIRISDIGRPLSIFSAPFSLSWLPQDVATVLETNTAVERLVDGYDNCQYRVLLKPSLRDGLRSTGIIANFEKLSASFKH